MPGLTPTVTKTAPDVRLWFGIIPPTFTKGASDSRSVVGSCDPDASSESAVEVWTEEGFFRFRYQDGTEFFLDQLGTQIWAVWPDQLTLEDTATYLLGPIISAILRLRGTLSLHASAIRIGDVAIALVGPQGAGKSTTAASFAVAGYAVLTDDVAALIDGGDFFQVIPAYPRIRLWPESVTMLFGSPDALPRLTPTWEKRFLELDSQSHRFETEPVPLAAIYFLHPRTDDPSTPLIDDEPRRDAMLKLIGSIGGNYLLDQVSPASSFDVLQRVAQSIPLRRLNPRTDPEKLPQLREMVVADIRALHVGASA